MIAFGKSDRGCVRPTNQDAFALDTQPQAVLVAVCDGMGGANAGNVASRFAIESFMAYLRQALTEDMQQEERQNVLRQAVEEANDAVFRLATAQPEFRGMGTTLVGGIITANGTTLVNVGDSRAYLIGQEGIVQLTEDHSYVEEMLRRGKISEEAARVHPNKNIITRAIGVDQEVECDIYEVVFSMGEILLFCSDGLTGMVQDERIAQIIAQAENITCATTNLIDEAKSAGGQDNITAVLLKYGAESEEE